MSEQEFKVREKELESMLIAAVRMKAKYSDCGQGFALIGKNFGRHICGPAMLLHYDCGQKEIAEYDACMPVSKKKDIEGISVRELAGGRAVTLVHKGPYDDLGRTYEQLTAYIDQLGCEVVMPTREVYLKGPGMLLRGNPKNYLTEIQMLLRQ